MVDKTFIIPRVIGVLGMMATLSNSAGDVSRPPYAVPSNEAGFYAIQESSLHWPKEQSGRVGLRISVRRAGFEEERQPEPAVLTRLDPGDLFDFDTFLGYLETGDTVHVVAEPEDGGRKSLIKMDYKVVRTPAIPVSSFPKDMAVEPEAARPGEWALMTAAASGSASARRMAWKSPLNPGNAVLERNKSSARLQLAPGRSIGAALLVEHSGYYALDDAWIRCPGSSDQAIEVRIYAGRQDEPRREVTVPSAVPDQISLNTDLGYIEKGGFVWIAFTSGNAAATVEFAASLIEWAPRRAPLRVRRGAGGYLDVYEPAAPRQGIRIPPERWITVPAREGDATEAIRKAFDEAHRLQKGDDYVGVRLEAGRTYTVASRQNGGNLFELKDTRRLIFDGNGSTLLVVSPELQRREINLFATSNSRQMAFAHFTVEDKALPYAIGKILKVGPLKDGNQTVTFKIEEGSADPLRDIRPDGMAGGYAYDAETPGRLAEGTWSNYPGALGVNPQIQPTEDPGVFTHAVTRTHDSIPVGAKWVIKNKKAGVIYLVADGNSEDITLSDIDGRASGGGALRNWGASAINILGCRFEPKGNHWISSAADGIHGQAREGVWVEDTLVRGICEDVMNTYGPNMLVVSDNAADDRTVSLRMGRHTPEGHLEAGPPPNPAILRAGDSLLFFNPRTGHSLGYANVQAVANGRVRLSDEIAGLIIWKPGEGKGSTIVYNTRLAANFFIRDSRFMDSLRFGVFIKARGGVIFNSQFEGMTAPAIFVANEPEWPEGPPATHLWLQGNAFSQNNYDYMSRHRSFLVVDPASISIYTRKLRNPSDLHGYQAHLTRGQYANSHMRIVGNTFHDWRGMGIAVRNARNVLIADNLFLPPVDDPVLRATLARDPLLNRDGKGAYAAIFLDSVDGVRVSGNRFYGLVGGDQGIVIGQDVRDLAERDNVSEAVFSEGLDLRFSFSEWFGSTSANVAPAPLGASSLPAELRGAERKAGRIGAGVTFDGKGDLVVLPASDVAAALPKPQLSLALWLRPKRADGSPQIIYAQGDSERGVAVAIDGGRFVAGLWQAEKDAWLDLGPAIPEQWQHVALVYDGPAGVLRGYVDGAEATSQTEGAPVQLDAIVPAATLGGALNSLRLGAGKTLDAASGSYHGELDEFYLFNRAIGPTEVSMLAMAIPPSQEP